MKFRYHLILEILILIILLQILTTKISLLIFATHFIPSLDYLMKEEKFQANLHRKLFHNIFIAIIVWGILFFTFGTLISLLGLANLLLHLILDLRSKKGIAIFFPFSNWRLKIEKS